MLECNDSIWKKINEIVNNKELDRDKKYMLISYLASYNSNDPHSKVGACIVKDDKLISIGWNRMPCEGDFSWDREGKEEDTKYPYVIHAERDAIYRATMVALGKDLEDASIYVNLFPCNHCMQQVVMYKMKELYYDCDKYHDCNFSKEARKIIREFDKNRDDGFMVKQIQITSKELEKYECLEECFYEKI